MIDTDDGVVAEYLAYKEAKGEPKSIHEWRTSTHPAHPDDSADADEDDEPAKKEVEPAEPEDFSEQQDA